MDGVKVSILSLLMCLCAVMMFNSSAPESGVETVKKDSKDALISMFVTSEAARFHFGLLAAVVAGVTFSMSHSLSKSVDMVNRCI